MKMTKKLSTLILGATLLGATATNAMTTGDKRSLVLGLLTTFGGEYALPVGAGYMTTLTAKEQIQKKKSLEKANKLIVQAYEGDGIVLREVLSKFRSVRGLETMTLDNLSNRIKKLNEQNLLEGRNFDETFEMITENIIYDVKHDNLKIN